MNSYKKNLLPKKLPKQDREMAILIRLVEMYIQSGKPIGSQTLQESGFESLSSATIRNYFTKLEERGFVRQQHSSGGRVPTNKAFRFYVNSLQNKEILDASHSEILDELFRNKDKGIAALIHRASEMLSRLSKCAVFISTPRFDQDFIQEVKLLRLDTTRLLAIVITDFGLIHPEIIYLEQEVDEEFLKKCERYFLWRMSKGEKASLGNELRTKQAQRIYTEVMMRHVVGSIHSSVDQILRCGVSRLLTYPEFSEVNLVIDSLALLENEEQMRALLTKCCHAGRLICWIGDELCPHVAPNIENSVIAIPYRINQTIAGAVALLGPVRIPYPELFGLIHYFSELMTAALTDIVYKYKITLHEHGSTLLENKRDKK